MSNFWIIYVVLCTTNTNQITKITHSQWSDENRINRLRKIKWCKKWWTLGLYAKKGRQIMKKYLFVWRLGDLISYWWYLLLIHVIMWRWRKGKTEFSTNFRILNERKDGFWLIIIIDRYYSWWKVKHRRFASNFHFDGSPVSMDFSGFKIARLANTRSGEMTPIFVLKQEFRVEANTHLFTKYYRHIGKEKIEIMHSNVYCFMNFWPVILKQN